MSVIAALPEVFAVAAAPRSTVSDALARGELRRLARGLYTRNLTDPPEQLLRRNLFEVVAALYPGALITDRSARLGGRPASDGSLFLVHERPGETNLPGLSLRPRKGPDPVDGDLPLPAGLHMSSVPRALLENTALSRSRRDRLARTLARAELEEWLESLIDQRGDEGFRALRQQAQALAPQLGLDDGLVELDRLMGAVLGTRRGVRARSPLLRARQAGQPYDPGRVERFEILYEALDRLAPAGRPAIDAPGGRYRFLPFFEAYFSNFIEGTEFALEEAREIVFDHLIPPTRSVDAHDIMGTYQLVADHAEMSRLPRAADELLLLLQARHGVLLGGRPEKHPGVFKTDANRVGAIDFVAPGLVEGTLREGYRFYQRLTYPFARAVFQMFLVSEVHPFDDGNGRVARVMMNAELVAASEARIIVPTVYRNNYLMALRALTTNNRPDALINTLDFAQRYTATIEFGDFDTARGILEQTHAFTDPVEADTTGVRLTLPAAHVPAGRWQIAAGPREYHSTQDGADIDVGWAWDLQRDQEQRTVRVEVAGGRQNLPSLPDGARDAINSHGRSALLAFLTAEAPPRRILITSNGIFSQ